MGYEYATSLQLENVSHIFCPPFKYYRLYKEVYLKCPKNTNNIQKKNIVWAEPFKKGQPYGMNLKLF
jgi:hypothetical protein